MEWRIEFLERQQLIGQRMRMSYAHNKTGELWKDFMPRRKEISNKIGGELYSIQVYPPGFFENFSPSKDFEKWAAVKVSNIDQIPPQMERFTLNEGLYAVFYYKGSSANGPEVFRFILEDWLPNSAYILDQRPHFEKLGDKYKNDSDDSEEEIWIPVKMK
jgi:AraC family transcriptional regulator